MRKTFTRGKVFRLKINEPTGEQKTWFRTKKEAPTKEPDPKTTPRIEKYIQRLKDIGMTEVFLINRLPALMLEVTALESILLNRSLPVDFLNDCLQKAIAENKTHPHPGLLYEYKLQQKLKTWRAKGVDVRHQPPKAEQPIKEAPTEVSPEQEGLRKYGNNSILEKEFSDKWETAQQEWIK